MVATTNWELSRRMGNTDEDSRNVLESFGFRITDEDSYIYYLVVPPLGWTKAAAENNNLITYIRDALGTLRLIQHSLRLFQAPFINVGSVSKTTD